MSSKGSEYVKKSRELSKLKKLAQDEGGSIEEAILIRVDDQAELRRWTGSEWELVPLEQEDSEHVT